MKKILVFNLVCWMALSALGQEQFGKSAQVPGNAPKELMINGKPYTQYKAEQEALKQQQKQNQLQVSAVNTNFTATKTAGADQKYPVNKVQQSTPGNGAEFHKEVVVVDNKPQPVVEVKTVQAPVLNDKINEQSRGTNSNGTGTPQAEVIKTVTPPDQSQQAVKPVKKD